MRVVFMGTPDFAVESLKAIHASRHDIVGIVTVPDRQQGRGLKTKPSPVKKYALENNLEPILQPDKLKDPEFISQLQASKADVFVVVAFRILPEEVFSLPPKGTINLHASYLPYYRGAAPINWAIINGEKETGVTTFLISKGVDTGHILLQQKVAIEQNETAGSLHDKLAVIGSKLLVETLDKLEEGSLSPFPQPEGDFPKAPKITKNLLFINWNQPAWKVKNLIHGLSPVPGARSRFRGKIVKILKVSDVNRLIKSESHIPGEIVDVAKDKVVVACKNHSFLELKLIQFEGKKQMSIEEAIRGYRFQVGEQFE